MSNVPNGNITSDALNKDLKIQHLKASQSNSLFKIMPANEWIEQAKTRPIPKMLFGEFWFEGELCILFADTNLGKSILAVQVGNSISKGKPILDFSFEAIKQPVLYFDFELSDKQFENRYSINFMVSRWSLASHAIAARGCWLSCPAMM